MDARIPSRLATGLWSVALCGAWLVALERLLVGLSGGAGGPGAATILSLWALDSLLLAGLGLLAAVTAPLLLRPWLYGLVLGLLSVAPTWVVGEHLVSGAWIAQQSWAPVVRWAPVVAGFLGMAVFGWAIARLPRALWLTPASLLASLACSVADSSILPGQHASFHLLAHALAALFVLTAAFRVLPAVTRRLPRLPRRVLGAASPLPVVAALLLLVSLRPAVRSQLVQHSPTGGRMLGVLGPPAPHGYLRYELEHLDEIPAGPPGPPSGYGTRLPTRSPSGEPWSVLLVSIDALRADALEPRRTKKGRRFAKPGDTPVLDELEDHCFRFRHVYSQSSSTHYSMPTMFRSTHAFEGDRVGRPLPVVMAELGLYPIALANNFFLEPRFEATARMLDGFERVSIYEMREMNEAVPLASELLEAVRDRRFFFWFHFYNMHLPGYAGRTLTRKDGRWPKRYRMALKWVDGQMGELLARLDALGLAERTLLVVASDHGEALGDNNRSSHGSTLYEEEVRVPLYLRVPGVEGRIVEEVVGNIDLVPTLLELLGAPPDPLMRGRSLVPLMVGDAARQTPDYYLKSHRRKFYGVVHGTDKLLWARKSGAWLRFDVAQDPTEDVNLFTSDGYMDLEMSRRLLRLHPGLLRAELKDPETLDVLRRRMEEAGASTPPAALDLLLRVAALSHDKALIRHGRRLFREAADDRARLLVLRRLYELDRAGLKPVLAERLDAVAGTREELELVSGLAAQRQPALPTKQTAARMRRWLDDRAGWLPWLTLTRPWTRKRPAQYAPVYADMLERLEPDAPEARLLLLGVASMRRAKGEAARRLAAGIGGWLEHPSSAVRAAACRALGSVGDEQAVPLLMGRLEQGRPRERQAVAYALGRIQGGAAVPLLTRLKDDPLLVLDVANVLGSLDTPKAIPPLEDIAKKFYNPNVRSRAAVALKGLRKRVEKKARKRRGKRKGKGKGAPPSAP